MLGLGADMETRTQARDTVVALTFPDMLSRFCGPGSGPTAEVTDRDRVLADSAYWCKRFLLDPLHVS